MNYPLLIEIWMITVLVTSIYINIILVVECAIKPVYYHYRFKRVVKSFKIKIPRTVNISNSLIQYKLSKNTYAAGMYLSDSDQIIMCCGKRSIFTYCSTLFHELAHWAERRLGREGVSIQMYSKAIREGNIKVQQDYFINELIAEKASEYIGLYYEFPNGSIQVFRSRRALVYKFNKNTKLNTTQYRYILREAKRVAGYILSISNKDL